MTSVSLDVPDDLAERLLPYRPNLPLILEMGLREFTAGKTGYQGVADVLEFLAGLPSPEETLALRASEDLETRLRELLEKNRTGGLSPGDEQEWRHYELLEHLVRMAKARALALTRRQ